MVELYIKYVTFTNFVPLIHTLIISWYNLCMYDIEFKKKVISLRKEGRTYSEINRILKTNIPKSTLSVWSAHANLSDSEKVRIEKAILTNSQKGRLNALANNRVKRERYFLDIHERIKHLKNILHDKNVAKIALSMLYLGEGSKTQKGSLLFCNSDPGIINLFLRLFRYLYIIDESKFRCTLQCRADQDIKGLEKFWSRITEIPASKFYKAQIDPRTIGKPSKKLDYKGVCRIDYFSADIYHEIMKIGKLLTGL